MIIDAWPVEFCQKYGYHFPADYVSFDTEFTGNSNDKDLVLEIGHTLVEGGKVKDKLNLILNWYDYPGIDYSWLDYKLKNNQNFVGKGWVLTPDYIKKNGINPLKALSFYQRFFETCDNSGLFFVAQNGITADERILRSNFNRYLNKSFSLPENRYFDTGAIFKANQIYEARLGDAVYYKSVILPHKSESLKSYFKRVIGLRISGLKWSLGLILDHYDLMSKHGVTEEKLHSAGYDSLCLHWIMEEYRNNVCSKTETEKESSVKPKAKKPKVKSSNSAASSSAVKQANRKSRQRRV